MVEILLICRYNKNDIKKGDVVMRAHTVILGAGATMAAIPNGDKNGKKSSVMNGMISKEYRRYIFRTLYETRICRGS